MKGYGPPIVAGIAGLILLVAADTYKLAMAGLIIAVVALFWAACVPFDS